MKVEASVNRLIRVLCERIAAGEPLSEVLDDYGIDRDALKPLLTNCAKPQAERDRLRVTLTALETQYALLYKQGEEREKLIAELREQTAWWPK